MSDLGQTCSDDIASTEEVIDLDIEFDWKQCEICSSEQPLRVPRALPKDTRLLCGKHLAILKAIAIWVPELGRSGQEIIAELPGARFFIIWAGRASLYHDAYLELLTPSESHIWLNREGAHYFDSWL